jgi:hypothetical protein
VIFAAGFIAGFVAALLYSVWDRWRAAKIEVNRARRRQGLPPEKRWWRL